MSCTHLEDSDLASTVDNCWASGKVLTPEVVKAITEIIARLSEGTLRTAEKSGSEWRVNAWVKKAIILYFRLKSSISLGDQSLRWFDKVSSKFEGWHAEDFITHNIRAVPMSHVREGAFIGKGTVLMPSFVNIGAYVGEGCMIDTWATVGSCAQIGNNVHISGGAGIGGVLEPIGSNPVIIEDGCFIGARSEIVEGMVIESGAVISMGVYLSPSTKIVDRETGEIYRGTVPKDSVVVPGSLRCEGQDSLSLYCAVLLKKADQSTRSKTGLNQDLRD